jgi:hypothetical protein
VDFVLLLNLQNLKRQDVQCGALTLKTELLDLSLLNINLSVLNTWFYPKKKNLAKPIHI